MNNAVGLPDVAGLLKRGIPVALGNDGFSNNMFDEMKAAYLAHKQASGDPQAMPGDAVMRDGLCQQYEPVPAVSSRGRWVSCQRRRLRRHHLPGLRPADAADPGQLALAHPLRRRRRARHPHDREREGPDERPPAHLRWTKQAIMAKARELAPGVWVTSLNR